MSQMLRRQSLYCAHPDILRRLTLRSSLNFDSTDVELTERVCNLGFILDN